jgi:hypothetical protein
MNNMLNAVSDKLNVIQQKVARAAVRASHNGSKANMLSHEPEEFQERFARLLTSREALRKVEAAVKQFIKKQRSLAKAAKAAGLAMGTPAEVVSAKAHESEQQMEDDILLKALAAKIHLLDTTVKERRRLEDIRLVRDHNEHRLGQVMLRREKGEGDDAKLAMEEAKWQAKVDLMQNEYKDLLKELSTALEFIDQETALNGPWALVAMVRDACACAAVRADLAARNWKRFGPRRERPC